MIKKIVAALKNVMLILTSVIDYADDENKLYKPGGPLHHQRKEVILDGIDRACGVLTTLRNWIDENGK